MVENREKKNGILTVIMTLKLLGVLSIWELLQSIILIMKLKKPKLEF